VQVKHLFPASAAAAIWNISQPAIAQPLTVDCYRGLILLLSFFPHRALSQDIKLPWNEWAQRALQLWGMMQQQRTWDHLWIAFFARLAKADSFVRSLVPLSLTMLHHIAPSHCSVITCSLLVCV
jgi:hypothetical protein